MIKRFASFPVLLPLVLIAFSAGPSPAAEPDLAGSCQGASLRLVADALKSGQDPCYAWVRALYGRVFRVGGGSGAIWYRNAAGGAVVATARHVLGDTADEPGAMIPELFLPPRADGPELFAHLALPSGTDVESHRNQTFRVYSTALTAKEYGNHYAGILPRHDFTVGVLTERKLSDEQISMDPPHPGPLKFQDPLQLARQKSAPAIPGAGEPVIILGFPRKFQGAMVFSTGTVLPAARAEELVALDPEESAIPLNHSVELVTDARSLSGHSGGAAFDRFGNYLGVLVRANQEPVGGDRYFTRVVRSRYVWQALAAKFSLSAPAVRKELGPFLSSP
jgi:hypothetical protein